MRIHLQAVRKALGEQFVFSTHLIGGEECTLIRPSAFHVNSIDWHFCNVYFRSSLWNSKGELISASYRKFFNFGEDKADALFMYSKKKTCWATEKIDGFTLVLSIYNGQPIIRTRGTAQVTNEEHSELALYMPWLMDQLAIPIGYMKNHGDAPPYSLIFEVYLPNKKIHTDLGRDPQIWLTNVVKHGRYEYLFIHDIEDVAAAIRIKTPKIYRTGPGEEYESGWELLKAAQDWKGTEGLCFYNGQNIIKGKTKEWLAKHYFDQRLSPKRLLQIMHSVDFDVDRTYEEIGKAVRIKDLDFEIKQIAADQIKRILQFKLLALIEISQLMPFVEFGDGVDDKTFARAATLKLTPWKRSVAFVLRKGQRLTDVIEARICSYLETYTVK